MAVFADVIGVGIYVPAVPEFAALFSASESMMGYSFAVFSAAFLLSVLPLGAALDRSGRTDLLVGWGVMMIAAAAFTFALAGSILTLSLAQAFHGIGAAATWVAAQPLAARLAAQHAGTVDSGGGGGDPDGGSSGRAQGIWFSVITVGMGLGLVAGPLVGTLGGLRTPFLIHAVLALAIAAISFVALRGHGGSPGAEDGQEAVPTGMRRYRQALANRGVLAACVAILAVYLAVGALESVFPLLMDTRGYEKRGIGVLFFWLAVFMVGSQPLATRWLDRVGVVGPTSAALAGIGLLLPVAALGSSFQVWIPVFAVLGVLNGVVLSATMALIASRSPSRQRGAAYALWNFAFSIGYLIGPATGGKLAEVSLDWGYYAGGMRFPFFVLAAAVVISTPVFARLARRGAAG